MEIKQRVFTGTVVSDKADKTITVLVTSYKKHRIYEKRTLASKKFTAHDERNEAKVGDVVRIAECRPMSATKRFRLIEIVGREQITTEE
jgi:small subunit ribosomal protein S17